MGLRRVRILKKRFEPDSSLALEANNLFLVLEVAAEMSEDFCGRLMLLLLSLVLSFEMVILAVGV
jgi:hypothetical protein